MDLSGVVYEVHFLNFFPGLDPSVICAKLRRIDNVQVDLSRVVYIVQFFLGKILL